MTTPAQQKLTNAYNEFIRDYVEAHGQNQATRDEAHERAAWCVSLGQSVAEMFIKFKLEKNDLSWVLDAMLDAMSDVKDDEAYLVACAVAVALEEVK